MIKNSEKATKFFNSFRKVFDKAMTESFTIDKIADMESEQFEDYKALAKSYQEFSELSMGIVEQMDEQTEILNNLQEQMKALSLR
ncbi:MAG: hypothetical protein J6Y02_11295 [Pseudobutyrivibrio sp.]|nr:hypothetical protein [Pseudobutyrivibrio sp.]